VYPIEEECLKGTITPDATLKSAAAPKTPFFENTPGKTARCACGADLRAQPTVDLGFKIFFQKKGKSTANTTIYSANCVSVASAFSCTSD